MRGKIGQKVVKAHAGPADACDPPKGHSLPE